MCCGESELNSGDINTMLAGTCSSDFKVVPQASCSSDGQDSVAIMGSQISQENSKDDCKTVEEPEQVRLGRKVEGESTMQVGCHSASILHDSFINMGV